MATSEWARSVGAVTDTPVVDYAVAGVNTTCHVAYRPPIAVPPFFLALSVPYFEQRLCRCGQLWPYVGMGSLGTCLHPNCNAMGDAANLSLRVPSKLSWRSVGRLEDMIPPGREDPQYLGKSEWDQRLGKIECVFSLYDKMRWKWNAIYPGVSWIYTSRYSFHLRCPCISVHPPSLLNNIFGSCDRASLKMNLTAEMEWTQRYTWRPWLSEFGHALGGRDRVNSAMHAAAVPEQVWRYTCRLWSSEIGGVLGGGRFGGRRDGSWDSIHWLTCNCGNVESWVQLLPRDEEQAGSGQLSILG